MKKQHGMLIGLGLLVGGMRLEAAEAGRASVQGQQSGYQVLLEQVAARDQRVARLEKEAAALAADLQASREAKTEADKRLVAARAERDQALAEAVRLEGMLRPESRCAKATRWGWNSLAVVGTLAIARAAYAYMACAGASETRAYFS